MLSSCIIVDLRSWKTKIEDDVSGADAEEEVAAEVHVEEVDTAFHQHQLFKDDMLTIGCCGKKQTLASLHHSIIALDW